MSTRNSRRFFFFNDTATTEIYTLSLHDALPISHQAGERHPHAVLVGDPPHDALPPHHARGQPGPLLVHARPPRGRGARHDDELRSLERGDRAGERVPRVLADQDRGPPPARVERADLPA